MLRRYRSLRTKLLGGLIMPTFLDLPNELFLQIAASLSHREISRLMQTNRFLARLLAPALLERAISARVGAQGCSILQWAAKHANLSLITRLLQRGIAVDTQDKTGMTALFSAVIGGRDSAVELLLRNGANPNAESRIGWTPLLLAAVSGNASVTAVLLRNGAAVDAVPGGHSSQNAMHYAAALGHLAVVDVLLAMGCDRGARDLYGVDAVRCARYFGRMDVVRRLLGGGTIVGNECADDEEDVRKRYLSVTATQFQLRLYERCLFIDQA